LSAPKKQRLPVLSVGIDLHHTESLGVFFAEAAFVADLHEFGGRFEPEGGEGAFHEGFVGTALLDGHELLHLAVAALEVPGVDGEPQGCALTCTGTAVQRFVFAREVLEELLFEAGVAGKEVLRVPVCIAFCLADNGRERHEAHVGGEPGRVELPDGLDAELFVPDPDDGFVEQADHKMLDELAFRGGDGEVQRVVMRAHPAVFVDVPLPAFADDEERRVGEELEGLVLQPVPLCVQLFGKFAGTSVNDVVDERGELMVITYR